jgi:hypothetical protein
VPIRCRMQAALLGALALALVTGCGDVSADCVRTVATRFAGAADDPGARCDLRAAATRQAIEKDGPCAAAIGGLPLGSGTVTRIEVWGEEAQARLSDDTVFLTHTAKGWRVSAAACTPQGGDRPHACQLEAS